jgi:hypothetical protein
MDTKVNKLFFFVDTNGGKTIGASGACICRYVFGDEYQAVSARAPELLEHVPKWLY